MLKLNPKQKSRGQILVIVLLVLSIMAIFIMSVAVSTRRDVLERARNEQYEQYYSLTEKQILTIIEEVKLETQQVQLDNILDDLTKCPNHVYIASQLKHTCEFTGIVPEKGSLDLLNIDLTIVDTQTVTKYPLERDRTFVLNLDNQTATGYRGPITMNWTGANIAWIVSLDIRDNTTGEYKTIKGVYDPSNIYQPGITSPYITFSGSTNTMSFNTSITPSAGTYPNNFPVNLPANYKMLAARFKPLMRNLELTEISISQGPSIPQVRNIKAEGYSSTALPGSTDSPTAVLEVNLPLYPAPPEIFDYVLRSETDVIKN